MQDYISLRIDATPCNETITDLLAAFLGDIGFESFSPDSEGLTAFIRAEDFDRDKVDETLGDFPMETSMRISEEFVKGRDWNEEWEKNYFKPIVVGDECVVHSSFHKDVPRARYDIVIDPKMAFGTGHHSTTSQMMRHILDTDMDGASVIDMGTGTGILAILCAMKGAAKVTGIEIDPFAWENAVENVRLNGVNAEMICGDATLLSNLGKCDILLANINRNIITSDIASYAGALKKGGLMFLSGFYDKDIPVVCESAERHGLSMTGKLVDNDWAAIRLVKTD